jgi:hypothetical protein
LAERDTLYEGRINPIYTDGSSHYIFGNRSMTTADSPLKQTSIVRLVLFMRKVINPIAKRLLFEPNDATVRSEFRRTVEPVLRDILTKRGITSYRIVLSSDPNDLDRGILNGSIIFSATSSLEEINLSFVLTPTGAEFNVN